MSIRGLKKWALLLTFWLALQTRYLRADDLNVSGNLSVTGTSDLWGNDLYFGTHSGTPNTSGLTVVFSDGTTTTVSLNATSSANIWKWQQNAGATLQVQMTLDNNNTLTLFDQSSTPVAKITLNPLGTSTFANSVTLNGTDNEMPNQTLVNSNSVLTEGLADNRYVSSGSITIGSAAYNTWTTGPTVSLNGGTATGVNSFAELGTASGIASTALGASLASGDNSTALGRSTASAWGSTSMGYLTTASGGFSTATGVSTTASGYYSMASGYASTASGRASIAMGYYSTASGNYSTAIGYHSNATGNFSTAMGNTATASGYYSMAMGFQTTAQAFDSIALGQSNIGGGTSNSWVPADPLFEIGNGTTSAAGHYTSVSGYWTPNPPPGSVSYSDYVQPSGSSSGYYLYWVYYLYTPPVAAGPSDAFVVYKNGNAAVQGSLSAGGPISTTGAISAASLSTTGTITAPAFITTAPSGDIPMYQGN